MLSKNVESNNLEKGSIAFIIKKIIHLFYYTKYLCPRIANQNPQVNHSVRSSTFTMIYSKNYTKVVLIFFISFVILMTIGVIYMGRTGRSETLNYQFNGKVDSVRYNIKGQAYVSINGVEYYLFDPDWNFDHNRIQIGDSLVKRKNSMIIELFRRNVLVTIEGKDN